ncbi:IPT/TIG domain-containing protein [Streptomyces sp. NPDC002055]|uniref:IPT/TIG domain-containing protein n=1 Tax=Streptomyces sp. NPDC002055 TaxID=3154534 RepID=UPI00332C1A4A
MVTISPNQGPVSGGTVVTIVGQNLAPEPPPYASAGRRPAPPRCRRRRSPRSLRPARAR